MRCHSADEKQRECAAACQGRSDEAIAAELGLFLHIRTSSSSSAKKFQRLATSGRRARTVGSVSRITDCALPVDGSKGLYRCGRGHHWRYSCVEQASTCKATPLP